MISSTVSIRKAYSYTVTPSDALALARLPSKRAQELNRRGLLSVGNVRNTVRTLRLLGEFNFAPFSI